MHTREGEGLNLDKYFTFYLFFTLSLNLETTNIDIEKKFYTLEEGFKLK